MDKFSEEEIVEKLFSPFSFKNCCLKNRIVMPALASFLVEDDGSITDKTVEHYRRRAAGGPGMVIVEASAVSPEGIVSDHQARIYDDSFLEGLFRIAGVIESEGAIPAIQLHHGGRQTSARTIGRRPVAPSNLPCPVIKGEVEPLTVEGIHKIVFKFGEAATRAFDAGFKLIEIHGAHGYLVNQFLSRFSNIREDHYGGDITGRSRFARDIIQEIRKRVGEDFPISFKISAQEFVPKGLTVDESIEILLQLVEAGIDIVQVSAGNDATPEWISQPMYMEKACLADSAARIKKALDIPVMVVGRINDPVIAEAILAKGKADLVCIGRGLLADPEMPKKAKEGRLDDIRTCIACNTCMESIYRKGRIECLVNPTLGREKEMEIHPADSQKKVLVVGGGPAGLQVAWVAARRGHDVSLYERESNLGGQLVLGSVSKYKQELLSLIEFEKRQIKKSGVKCHLNVEVTPKTIKEEDPDVIVLATGSVPILPALEGIDRPIVMTPPQIFNGKRPDMKKTIVVGGGATGCEAALHLSEDGSPVTIVEQLPRIGTNIESVTKRVILKKLKANQVEVLVACRLSRVLDNGVFITDKEGKERFLEGERVVIAIGNVPHNGLFSQIQSLGKEVYQLGDCLEPRSAKAAIYEGAVLGRTI